MCDVPKTLVPDEVVIEALLKDARRFKSKWELHSNEPTRSKPNVVFLKRTLSNVVKVNEDRMRKPKQLKERDNLSSINNERKHKEDCEKSSSSNKSSRSRRDLSSRRRSKKSGCSKSKYRSPESRNKKESSRKAKREKEHSITQSSTKR